MLGICRYPGIHNATGVESGERGTPLPIDKPAGDIHPEIVIFEYLFLVTYYNFTFFVFFFFKLPKWPESEEKLSFGVR